MTRWAVFSPESLRESRGCKGPAHSDSSSLPQLTMMWPVAYSTRNRPPLTMQTRHWECSQTRHPKWPESATKMRLVRRLSRYQGERDAQVTEHGRRIDVLAVSLKGRQAAKGRSRPRPCENSRSALTSANLDCFLPSVAKSECLDICSLLRMRLSRATQIVFTQPGPDAACGERLVSGWPVSRIWPCVGSSWRASSASRCGSRSRGSTSSPQVG